MPALREDTDDTLRIVAAADGRQNLFVGFQYKRALGECPCCGFGNKRIVLGSLADDQNLECPACIERVDGKLQTFRDKGSFRVAVFFSRPAP